MTARTTKGSTMNKQLESLYDEWFAKTNNAQAAATLAVADFGHQESERTAPAKSEYLTVTQAAREFNVSARSLYRLRDIHKRNGSSVRIKRSDLVAHLEGHESLFD